MTYFLFSAILATDVGEGSFSAQDTPCVPSPIVQVEIRVCSTYAVVCRLKSSPVYTVTSHGGTFMFPDYPNVILTIPKGVVASKAKMRLQMKVSTFLDTLMSAFYTGGKKLVNFQSK